MKGYFNVRRFIAAAAVAVMIITEVFIGIRVYRDLKAADEMTVQTEGSCGQEAEELKDKAYRQLWLALCFGVLMTGMSAALAVWADR